MQLCYWICSGMNERQTAAVDMITTPIRHTLNRLILLTLLLTLNAGASAETRYVTDILQLSLYEEINSKGKLLERLNSGTQLELLETSGFYARVRTQDGTEGWTKAGFLISEKPARTQLTELQEQNARLQQEMEERQQALEAKQAELSRVMDSEGKAYAEMAQRLENAERIAATVDQLQAENEAFRSQLIGDETRVPLKWGMTAAGITLLIGIGAGIALFDYRSRRRHGGFRIY